MTIELAFVINFDNLCSMGLFGFGLSDEHGTYMREALKEAVRGMSEGEVPVGCVIVHDGRVIGRGHNQRERLQDATAHAEMIAISAACQTLGTWRLEGCSMYVTLEPCAMCAGALVLSRVERLIFGASDPKGGACGTLFNIVADKRLNHEVEVIPGVLADDAGALLRDFFKGLRVDRETEEE